MFSLSDAQFVTDPVLRDQIEQHPRAQDLLRAFLYPYHAPDHDFLFRSERKLLWDLCIRYPETDQGPPPGSRRSANGKC